MSESIKFGPEWLRNSLSTSPKQEEVICRPILSNNRYSKEEMLGLLDERNSKKSPEYIANGSRRLHIDHFQPPMVLIPSDDERPACNERNSRTFINSNIKHGYPPNNNWRKNAKEPEQENWRSTDHKRDYHPSTSRNGEKSKPNWRDKAGSDEPFLSSSNFPYSPAKDYEFKAHERDEISPIKTAQKTPKRAETVEEKQNQYVLNIVSDTATKSLFENSSKTNEIKKIETPNIQTKSSSSNNDNCELNFKKLENDIMMGLQELSVDDEIIERSSACNKQQNVNNISWFYIDPIGKIQGPFQTEEMSLWYNHGFFYDTLMLRRSIDSNFISFHHFLQAFGTAQPFAIASTGFPIPKVENHAENLSYKQPPKVSIINPQNQYDATMYRGHNLVQSQYQDIPQNYQNNHPQFQPNYSSNYQYHQNRQLQPNIPQIDPRLMNMNNGNPYIQTFNAINNNPNRIPQQMPPQMMNQMPQQMKTPYQGQLMSQYPQSMIHQMPNIIPTNPIQKLLFELQKQKELEQQRAMYIQHSQNVAVQTMNEQIMQQQQNKMESIRQNNLKQAYYNNIQNKYEHNGNIAVNSNNQAVQQNNMQHNEVIDHPQEPESVDADDEGEFRVVGNLKRKKFQKEKEKCEKVKENGPQTSRSVTKLPEGKITVIKNDLKPLNTDVKPVKSNNDVSQMIINQLNKVEEKTKLPAMPAPWIDKVAVNNTESENLKRIQIEEEEIRQIEQQMQREKELEMLKKEKVPQLSWNIVVNEKTEENADELPAVWEVPSKNVKRNSRPLREKPIEGNSSNKEVENEFKNWCMDMLSKMNTSIDIPVFVGFLIGLECPFEIEDYVKMYLGETIESHLFIKKFLERRSLYRKAIKKVEVDDDLNAPPKAINPGTHQEEMFRTQNKKKLDKKTKKGLKVDANILGFKSTAASNRIVGELHEDEY